MPSFAAASDTAPRFFLPPPACPTAAIFIKIHRLQARTHLSVTFIVISSTQGAARAALVKPTRPFAVYRLRHSGIFRTRGSFDSIVITRLRFPTRSTTSPPILVAPLFISAPFSGARRAAMGSGARSSLTGWT